MKTRWRRADLAMIGAPLILAVHLAALGQDLTGQEQKVLRHDAAAVIKLVTVRVLDGQGRPVTSLTKDDFVLHDNEEPRTITEFEVHTLAGLDQSAARSAERVSASVSAEKNRKFFILLDIQGSEISGVTNAKKAALHFIETKLRPGDEVGVLTYAPMTGLNMVTYLTADKTKIKKAIERAKEVRPSRGEFVGGFDDDDETSEASPVREWGHKSSATFIPGTSAFAATPADFRANMSELAKALEHIPGAKQVILFSGRNAGKPIGLEFAAANIPVFAVNTNSWVEGVKHLTPPEKQALDESPLRELALASGGKYFAHIQDIEAISVEIQDLTANFYVLGYYITESWDGRYHRIKVEVRKPGFQVFAQEGYFGAKPYSQYSILEKQLHAFDLVYADRPVFPGSLNAAVEALTLSDGRGSSGLALARVRVDEKTGLPPGKAEFFMVVFDQRGAAVVSLRGERDLESDVQKAVCIYTPLQLPVGEYEFRFAARDTATGQAVVGRSSFKIETPGERGLAVHAPLLLLPGEETKFLRLCKKPKRQAAPPTFVDFYPFIPKNCVPLAGSLDTETRALLAVVPVTFRANPAAEVSLDVVLKPAAGGEADLADSRILEVKQLENGPVILIVEVALPKLANGEYVLELRVADSESGAVSVAKASFIKK